MPNPLPCLLIALALAGASVPVRADPFTPGAADEPRYRSSFHDFRPDEDVAPDDWRAVNDRVGRIGGWRSYLGEADAPPPRPQGAAQGGIGLLERPSAVGERVAPAAGDAR
ncbi:MAG: hypothetical protein R3E87_18810 [Burkholderiaceae bacterium]